MDCEGGIQSEVVALGCQGGRRHAGAGDDALLSKPSHAIHLRAPKPIQESDIPVLTGGALA